MGPASAAELPVALPAGALDSSEGEVERAEAGPVDLPLWQPNVRERVREAWQSRHLVPGLARSSIGTYEGRILGRAWLVISPVMEVFSVGVLFGGIFNAQTPNDVPYLIYAIFGMQAFRIVSITVMYETKSVKMVRPMTRGLAFPLLLVPFSTLGRVLFHLVFYWVIAAGLIVYYLVATGHLYLQLNARLLVGIAGILLCLGYGLALGLFTSVIYPRARDIRYMERYALQAWILITPVFYSIHTLPHTYQVLAQLNPLTSLIGMVQYGFVDAGFILPWGILWAVGLLVILIVVGVWFYNRYATRWIGIPATSAGVDDDDFDDGDDF